MLRLSYACVSPSPSGDCKRRTVICLVKPGFVMRSCVAICSPSEALILGRLEVVTSEACVRIGVEEAELLDCPRTRGREPMLVSQRHVEGGANITV